MTWFALLFSMLLLWLGLTPLLHSSGQNFEYQYALALSWLLLIGLPIFGLLIPKTMIEMVMFRRDPARLAPLVKREYLLLVMVFLLGPLALAAPAFFSFSVGACACNTLTYRFWFLLQVVPSYLWGVFGMFFVMASRWNGPWHTQSMVRHTCWLGFFSFSYLALLLALIWFSPQKRIVSVFFGFLHGPIYDDWIPVDTSVLAHRLLSAMVATVFVVLSLDSSKIAWLRAHVKQVAFVVALIFLPFFFFQGTGHGLSLLEQGFVSETVRPDLILMLDKAIVASQRQKSVKLFKRELMFHFDDLKRIMSVTPAKPVRVFVYASKDQKKIKFGGGDTDITDVFTPSIHVTLGGFPHETLRHELVHALAADHGWNGLGFHPNMAVTEGLAVALAPYRSGPSLDGAAYQLIHKEKAIRMETLFNPLSFWSESGVRAYTLAGSFIKFVLEAAPDSAWKVLYSGGDFKEKTGLDLEAWVEKWTTELKERQSIALTFAETEMLKNKGILNDECPHSKADLSRWNHSDWSSLVRRPGGWSEDHYLNWRKESFSDGDRFALRRIKRALEADVLREETFQDEGSILLADLRALKQSQVKSLHDLEVVILEVDLLLLLNSVDAARDVLKRLVDDLKGKSPGDYWQRQLDVRSGLLDLDHNVQVKILRYFYGAIDFPAGLFDRGAVWLYDYLQIKSLKVKDRDDHLSAFEISNKILGEIPQSIRREWLRVLAYGALEQKKYDDALELFTDLQKSSLVLEKPFHDVFLRMALIERDENRPTIK